jgi:DNA-binding LytR/AlgR family response regulator
MRVLREDGSAFELDDKDILCFSTYQNVITIHTQHEQFILPTSFDLIIQAYKDISYQRVDRAFIVNMNEVKGYNQERKSVFFEDPPTKDSTYAYVSEPNYKRILDLINQKFNNKKD